MSAQLGSRHGCLWMVFLTVLWCCMASSWAGMPETHDAAPAPLDRSPFAPERLWLSPSNAQWSRVAGSPHSVEAALQLGVLKDWDFVGYAARGDRQLAWVERAGKQWAVKVGQQLGSEGAVLVHITPERLQFEQKDARYPRAPPLMPYLPRKGRSDAD